MPVAHGPFISSILQAIAQNQPVVLPPRVRNPDYHRGPVPKDMYVPAKF